jgi:glycosyltransferase involved in cell wall biosynthesis
VAAAAVLCAPSRWEGFSVVLAEALTLGTPVIAADCPHGPREVVDGGRFGALVGVDDVDGLSRALAAHLAAPEDLRRRAAAGRAEAVERFDLRREAADARAALATLTGAAGQPERRARRRPGIRRTRGS